jgi:hypothetical protein
MTLQRCVAVTAAVLITAGVAYAQSAPPSPVIKNPNPASSATTDEDGSNPLAREGENSPTGHGPSVSTDPPQRGTVGSGLEENGQDSTVGVGRSDTTVDIGASESANFTSPEKSRNSFSYWSITKIPSLAGPDLTTLGPFLLEPDVPPKPFSKAAERGEPVPVPRLGPRRR